MTIKVWITAFKDSTSGFCSVSTKMVKWKEQLTPDCPHCGQIENAQHVWLCPEPAVYFVWALFMSSFSDWILTSLRTATEITYWIIKCLTEWQSQEPFSMAHTDLRAYYRQYRLKITWAGWLSSKDTQQKNGPEFNMRISCGSDIGIPASDGQHHWWLSSGR
jgi:hypothetical protein